MDNPDFASLDKKDKAILDLLDQDARQPAAAIAGDPRVDLSAAAVRRRISRLQDEGVIVGFTTVLDHTRVEPAIEAYVEVNFSAADVRTDLTSMVDDHPEVREASTLAGDPDALVRLRVLNLHELREVVTRLREAPGVTDTKTLVALGRIRHVARAARRNEELGRHLA
jgi:Lrp/AsnC family transcriptional regulator, leucine-responsive regulatory protein